MTKAAGALAATLAAILAAAGACERTAAQPAAAAALACEASSPLDPGQSAFLDELCREIGRLLEERARSGSGGEERWVRLDVEFLGPRTLRSTLSWGSPEKPLSEATHGETLTTTVSDRPLTSSIIGPLAADLIERSPGVVDPGVEHVLRARQAEGHP